VTDEVYLAREAAQLVSLGRMHEASARYRELLTIAHTADATYEDWVASYVVTAVRSGQNWHAAYAQLYLGEFTEAQRGFATVAPGTTQAALSDCARAAEYAAAQAGVLELTQKQLLREAASRYADAVCPIHAAICRARAGDHEAARQAWERLLGGEVGGPEGRRPLREAPLYIQALVRFNLGRACRRMGDPEASDRHLAEATRLLEEAADEFEAKGLRERAFDCYQILIEIGRDLGAFENLAEGYINSIRVLKEDDLRLYALQYYEDFLRVALEREEYHAAATLYGEAAEFAQRSNLNFVRHYQRRAGETWWAAADKSLRLGGPTELAESALLQAVDSYNALGDYFRVRETYRRLADLELPQKRRDRYARIAARYADVWREENDGPAFSDHLRQPNAYADIWHTDLKEWEQGGSFREVAATVVADRAYAPVIRRRALNLVLYALDTVDLAGRPAGNPPPEEALAQIATLLGSLQLYVTLSPLERLYGDARATVRKSVMRSLKHLMFKRTFGLVRQGLIDANAGVREDALGALVSLHFPHAFEPLVRIFREHDDLDIKSKALESIAQIGSVDAGTFLIDVVRFEGSPLRDVAAGLLRRSDNPEVLPIIERHAEVATGVVRAALEHVLTMRRRA
jgi:hypothetical protein